MPAPNGACLFGIQPWDIFRIVRREACSQKHKEYHTKSSRISMHPSGAQGTHVIRLRIFVSWENLPQEDERHKNRAMWIFLVHPSTSLASFPQCSHICLNTCISSYLCKTYSGVRQFPFTDANKGQALYRPFAWSEGRGISPRFEPSRTKRRRQKAGRSACGAH